MFFPLQDLRGTVIKFAEFLGYQLSSDVIDKIVQHCTFSNMKQNRMANPDFFLKELTSQSGEEKTQQSEAPSVVEDKKWQKDPNGSYMRKGMCQSQNLFSNFPKELTLELGKEEIAAE